MFAAKLHAAALAHRVGDPDLGTKLHSAAQSLRKDFEVAFWCEELGTFALALDGGKLPCRVRTSNAGHALFTGIASPELAVRVARTLLGPDSFSGWGIRTVANGELRFNPISYHNGSVWPHDNAMIALGFARYGLVFEAARIFPRCTKLPPIKICGGCRNCFADSSANRTAVRQHIPSLARRRPGLRLRHLPFLGHALAWSFVMTATRFPFAILSCLCSWIMSF